MTEFKRRKLWGLLDHTGKTICPHPIMNIALVGEPCDRCKLFETVLHFRELVNEEKRK